jgi:phosphoglycolate phosphatase-like HAD superfamily hydrolase
MRALISDLDGTLSDAVYALVFAWRRGLAPARHPAAGMLSVGLLTADLHRSLDERGVV